MSEYILGLSRSMMSEKWIKACKTILKTPKIYDQHAIRMTIDYF